MGAIEPGARIPSDENEIIISLKKGIWSSEEDSLLINYIAIHGEGRWNYVARDSGLRRTGKSCRLRWKNYLCPNVRRGNFTAEEQRRIADLHRFFGNRWSKIAEFLPGRTDNEIKNYWRTRVQKHAKHLKYDKLSEQIHASPCSNNNYNLGNHLMINYEACGSEALQMDCWASSLSTNSLEAHQVAAANKLAMNNDCEFYSIKSSEPNFRERYYDPHNTYSESSDCISYGELSNMLLNDDWYKFWPCP